MNPLKLMEQLKFNPINFKLKGTVKIKDIIHLGCRFAQRQFGALYMDPGEYVSQVEDAYVYRFRIKPK